METTTVMDQKDANKESFQPIIWNLKN
jgi:hypothetical protein